MSDYQRALDRYLRLDYEAKEICPGKRDDGTPCVVFSHRDEPTELMLLDGVRNLSRHIRAVDPDRAAYIDDCIEKAKGLADDTP